MQPITFGPDGVDRRVELAAVGPVIDILIRGPRPGDPVVRAKGLIDTGASVVCIDKRIALNLGLKAVNTASVGVAGGLTIESTVYMGVLDVSILAFQEIMPLYSGNMKQSSHDVLLGRSFLRNFIVTFNGPEGMFHFSRPPDLSSLGLDDDFAS